MKQQLSAANQRVYNYSQCILGLILQINKSLISVSGILHFHASHRLFHRGDGKASIFESILFQFTVG